MDLSITAQMVMVLWFLPVAIVGASRTVTGREKRYWMLAAFLFNWFALAIFFVLTGAQRDSISERDFGR